MPINFRTALEYYKIAQPITHQHTIMMLGSCFTNSIGSLFEKYQFNIQINPFGITYNPISIAKSIEKLLCNDLFVEQDLFFHQDLYGSYLHHGDFNHADKNTCLTNMNLALSNARKQLKKMDYLFITFGTNSYYELKDSNMVVNNCHKFPASYFNKKNASAIQIVDALKNALIQLRQVNPKCKLIFSISPIRYLQDGMFANSINKSNLFIAVESLLNEFENAYYFPAYEIVMDDLRDYRFYKEDMLHPNEIAIKYIWQQVNDLLLDEKENKLMKQIQKIQSMKAHRPINEKSEMHLKFLASVEKDVADLKKKYPSIHFNF